MTLTVRLPVQIESELARHCEALGMSKSQVVQGALKAWLGVRRASNGHPLLAFADTSARLGLPKGRSIPYSKTALRELARKPVGLRRQAS